MDNETRNVLLVEDNPLDVILIREALQEHGTAVKLRVVKDGVDAMAYLRQEGVYAGAPRPEIILLNLNLPRKDGREVLEEIKSDNVLRRIPVIVLTTSEDIRDIVTSYDLHANCYITKPMNQAQFEDVISSIEDFWFNIVRLPQVP